MPVLIMENMLEHQLIRGVVVVVESRGIYATDRTGLQA